ncbi:MAG TPA: hypothetical protein VJM48_06200 [Methylibium sp.]|nr:hypothetical protein [Methylibium sp.]
MLARLPMEPGNLERKAQVFRPLRVQGRQETQCPVAVAAVERQGTEGRQQPRVIRIAPEKLDVQEFGAQHVARLMQRSGAREGGIEVVGNTHGRTRSLAAHAAKHPVNRP